MCEDLKIVESSTELRMSFSIRSKNVDGGVGPSGHARTRAGTRNGWLKLRVPLKNLNDGTRAAFLDSCHTDG